MHGGVDTGRETEYASTSTTPYQHVLGTKQPDRAPFPPVGKSTGRTAQIAYLGAWPGRGGR